MEKPILRQRSPLTLDYWEVQKYILEQHGKDIDNWEGKGLFRDYLVHRDESSYYPLTDAWLPESLEWVRRICKLLFEEFEDCLVENYGDRFLYLSLG